MIYSIDILFLAIFQFLLIRIKSRQQSIYSGFTIIFKYSNSQHTNQKYSVHDVYRSQFKFSSCLKTGSPNIANLVKSK